MGINTTMYKVIAFALNALLCGLAGGLYAYWHSTIDPPTVFDLTTNVRLIIMAVLGGIGTPLGPIIGAVLLTAIQETLWKNFTNLHAMLFGAAIIVVVLLMPRGIVYLIRQKILVEDRSPAIFASIARLREARDGMTDVVLAAEHVSKVYGGVTALRDASFELHRGEILGLIGPNGAGKTTLINTITGVDPPTTGHILFHGKDLYARSGAAAGRLAAFPAAREDTRLSDRADGHRAHLAGRQTLSEHDGARECHGRRALWQGQSQQRQRSGGEGGRSAWSSSGSTRVRDRSADELTIADRKRLELAKALAMEPEVLLLDEVMAGLNLVEIERAMDLVRTVRDARRQCDDYRACHEGDHGRLGSRLRDGCGREHRGGRAR